MKDLYFEKINLEKLDKVLNFLSEGFNWSNNRSERIKKFILQSNKEIDLFGFETYFQKCF